MEEVKQWECGTQEYAALEQRPVTLNSFHPTVLLTVGVWLESLFKSLKRVISQKMQAQWKFYCPGRCNFFRASSSQADNPIFSYLCLCPSCPDMNLIVMSLCTGSLRRLVGTKTLGGYQKTEEYSLRPAWLTSLTCRVGLQQQRIVKIGPEILAGL